MPSMARSSRRKLRRLHFPNDHGCKPSELKEFQGDSEKGRHSSVRVSDKVLSGLSLPSERRTFMPFHSDMFPVRP